MTTRPRSSKRDIDQYEHNEESRANNPPSGLVTPTTDPVTSDKKTYLFDPHLDPQLVWAGKAERTTFEVSTVSLHVHERIGPLCIIEAVRKVKAAPAQLPLFETPRENPPLRQAVDFYRHKHGWSNRLVAGDSLLVMNSLLEKEGLAGQVQMIYIDPPYGIKYGSNFQPFVNKRDVKDGKDEDLTAEPEQIRAFRDTWELGIHSYLSYMRDRLLLARELLSESGSVFVQISDENVHHVRELMDEVFGVGNIVGEIAFTKTGGFGSEYITGVYDILLFYAKSYSLLKYRKLYVPKAATRSGISNYGLVLLPDGSTRNLTREEKDDPTILPQGSRLFGIHALTSAGGARLDQPFEFEGRVYNLKPGDNWKASYPDGLNRLVKAGRIAATKKRIGYIRYFDDFPYVEINNLWVDTRGEMDITYVVQTSSKIIERCMLITTDPGDLVFDPTCGSGTTAYVAERWGRRWITCDTSRVALTLAKQRLMTAVYDYYELAHPQEGVGSGFIYETVPHVTLRSIANNEPPGQEMLYDQPPVDKSKARVTGPFTVEAVPAARVIAPSAVAQPGAASGETADVAVAREGETLRQREWRDELRKTGIRGKGGQRLEFTRVEPLAGTRWLHAEAETHADPPQRAVVSFGPEHGPLDPRQVALALEEALTLVPRPELVVFAAFQFDPEAAKDIEEINWAGVTLLKVQMNTDLLTTDLRKKRASNESFWLVGQPDVELRRIKPGEHVGEWQVEVRGFDYYNTRTGELMSGGAGNIAMWMLDTDYDGRSVYPRQVFFPLADDRGGWARLARSLRAEIDEDLIEQYRGTVSLPFALGGWKRVAVKIVDDRGIESLKVLEAK